MVATFLGQLFEKFMTGRDSDVSIMYDIETPAERLQETYNDDYSISDSNSNSSEVCKILYFGNSYIFANDFGAQLAVTANLQNKKFVIVSATHQNIFQEDELAANCWDNQSGTIVLTSDGKYLSGTRKFSDILNQDWGNLGRGGSWDYIITTKEVRNQSIKFTKKVWYDVIKDYIPSSKRFISLDTENTNNEYSYVLENSLMRKYGENISGSLFLMSDNEKHPTVFKQYFRAMIIYAKIFGIEGFPKSEDSDSFIKFYNENNKELKDNEMYNKVMVEYRTTHSTAASRSVTERQAKKMQFLVYKYYDQYINR